MDIYISQAKVFILKYKIRTLAIGVVLMMVIVIIVIWLRPNNKPEQIVKQQTKTTAHGTSQPVSPELSQSPQYAVISSAPDQPYSVASEEQDIAFRKIKLDEDKMTEESISQQPLPDGSTRYDYLSDDPNRPHVQIIKDSVPIFRRNLVPGNTLSDYAAFLSSPEYIHQGSSYYGSNSAIYAAPSKGLAIVINSQTGQVYEQYLFQALPLNQYLQKYGVDITLY